MFKWNTHFAGDPTPAQIFFFFWFHILRMIPINNVLCYDIYFQTISCTLKLSFYNLHNLGFIKTLKRTIWINIKLYTMTIDRYRHLFWYTFIYHMKFWKTLILNFKYKNSRAVSQSEHTCYYYPFLCLN